MTMKIPSRIKLTGLAKLSVYPDILDSFLGTHKRESLGLK